MADELSDNLERLRKLVGTDPKLKDVVEAQQDSLAKLIKTMNGRIKPRGKRERE